MPGWKLQISKIYALNIGNFKCSLKWKMLENLKYFSEAIVIWLIQDFEADFLWKVNLKILYSE